MKYSKVIEIDEYFTPYFNLEDEHPGYWKRFIPTNNFYTVLDEILNSINSRLGSERLSIWLQGTYGTGKSHATSVIKHLLWDDIGEIDNFIRKIENYQLKHKLYKFREKNKIFPVVIKGLGQIVDGRTFSVEIQKAVKNSLNRENLKNVVTKTSFESMINQLSSNKIFYWDKIFAESELSIYGNRSSIIEKLKKNDVELLLALENFFLRNNISLNIPDISQWLIELQEELERKNIASGIVIYWDEFTGILELKESKLLLTHIQNIAELSEHNNIFLFIISHRKPYYTNLPEDDVKKILDRFKVKEYSMETITTYHLINSSMVKKESDEFESLKERKLKQIESLIDIISENEDSTAKEEIVNLFPIHPYTGFLMTFIAKYIGSSERSIFFFLNNKEKGFIKFLNDYPKVESGEYFLTVDHLWDFFYEVFKEINNDQITGIVNKYQRYCKSFPNERHLKVFKTILLLNILSDLIQTDDLSLLLPSDKNIKNIYKGILSEDEVEEILKYIDENGVISKNPEDIFQITGGILPAKEILEEKRRKCYSIVSVVDILGQIHKNNLSNELKQGIFRESEINILGANNNLKEIDLKINIKRLFKKNYTLKVVFFLPMDELDCNTFALKRNGMQVIEKLKSIAGNVVKENDYKDIIFLISSHIFNYTEFKRYLDFKAKSIVAQNHNYIEERNLNDQYANEILDKYVMQITEREVELLFRGVRKKMLFGNLSEFIQNNIAGEIFKYGIENIDILKTNVNVWKNNKNLIEIVISSQTRSDYEEKLNKKDRRTITAGKFFYTNENGFAIDEYFNIKRGIDHVLVHIVDAIDRKLSENKEKESFNLGKELLFLKSPPYGVYPIMPYYGIISFALKKYVNKLFDMEANPINEEKMVNLVKYFFDYLEKRKNEEKLYLKFGGKVKTDFTEKAYDKEELEEKIEDKTEEKSNNLKFHIVDKNTYFNSSFLPEEKLLNEIEKKIESMNENELKMLIKKLIEDVEILKKIYEILF